MGKSKYPINEKSFFATSETVGSFWRAATRARKDQERYHKNAAINKPSTMAGKIVVVPPERGSNGNQ